MATQMDRIRIYGGIFCGTVLLFALTAVPGAVPAWAQSGEGLSAQPGSAQTVNKALPGMMKGIMTSFKNGKVRIGHETYALSPDVLLEDTIGQGLSPNDLAVFNGFDRGVQYWLGTGQAAGQIIQMIVHYPQ